MNLSDNAISGFLLVLCASPFIRFATIFTFFRYALGLRGTTIGVATAILSLLLSLSVLSMQVPGGSLDVLRPESWKVESLDTLRPVLERQVDSKISAVFAKKFSVDQTKELPKNALLAAFILSELRRAFEVGLLIIVPFLLVDLVVANALMLLSIQQLPVYIVSIPLKLLLFFSVDGWGLITDKILSS